MPFAPPYSSSDDRMASTWRRRVWFVWALIWAGCVTFVIGPISVVTFLLQRRPEVYRNWSRRWARGILAGAGVRVQVTGAPELEPGQPYVFVSNHQNAFDIPVLMRALEVPFGFVAKAELQRIPVLGQAIRHSLSVFLDRSTPRRSLASMKQAGERIRGGNAVLVFPEGKRSYEAAMSPFKKGAFLLAVEAGVPLVPVTILDGYRVLDEERRLARRGTVHVHLGAPISLEGCTRRDIPELMERLQEAVAAPFEEGLPVTVEEAAAA